jgi:hypothetical protein
MEVLVVRALAIAATRAGARFVATQVQRLLESCGGWSPTMASSTPTRW